MVKLIGCTKGGTAQSVIGRKKRQAGPEPSFCDTCETPAAVDAEHKFLYFYMSTSQESRLQIGHQFSDLIKDCLFRGRDCMDQG